jgi:acyl phosphate:glycerol-3-phosphate acyltransferase
VEIAGYIIVAMVAYCLGSIPTGFLVAKFKGIDIRTVGSGNIGATNVLRILGTRAGIFVLAIDGLKGFVAVAAIVNWYPELQQVAPGLFGTNASADAQLRENFGVIAGLFAVLGHNYTCWLHFKGGKGIATSAGVLAALVPLAFVTSLAAWIILFATTRYVSVGSLSAAAVLPFATWFTTRSWTLTIATGAMSALAIYKHKSNIQRLIQGTENRIGRKKTPPAGSATPGEKA